MKFVVAALVVILFFWLINSSFIDRHAPETDGPLGWRNGYSLRGSALAKTSDSQAAADQALGIGSGGPGVTGSIPNTGERVYTIQPGDTLGGIAQRYGVTVGQILFANPSIQNADLIYAGQQIIIPVPGSPSAQGFDPRFAQALG